MHIRTDAKSLDAAWRQNETDNGDKRQQNTWNDVVDDTVQRQTTKMKTECYNVGFSQFSRDRLTCKAEIHRSCFDLINPLMPTVAALVQL